MRWVTKTPVTFLVSRKCDDEFVDLFRSDRIEARCRFVVKHDIGSLISARARATRRFMPPESSEGILSIASSSPTKPRLSRTFAIDFVFVDAQFIKPVGDILPNVHRIEERRFLKHHPDFLPDGRQVPVRSCG